MTETLTHFIGGKQISAPGALESTNPSNTNEIVAKFPDGSVEDVNDAVAAARSAFPGWSGATPEPIAHQDVCEERFGKRAPATAREEP